MSARDEGVFRSKYFSNTSVSAWHSGIGGLILNGVSNQQILELGSVYQAEGSLDERAPVLQSLQVSAQLIPDLEWLILASLGDLPHTTIHRSAIVKRFYW